MMIHPDRCHFGLTKDLFDVLPRQVDATEMEHALEAANIVVDVLNFASSQLDALTKSSLKRCGHSCSQGFLKYTRNLLLRA
jgi:hypothetical protein